MKGKVQGIVGLLIIGFLAFGLIKSIYKRNFADAEITVLKPASISAPVKNAMFWYEEELEHTADVMVSAKLSGDGLYLTQPLFADLKSAGMASEQIKTMSEVATKKLIELDAYRGAEPDVWEIAEAKGNPYIFKVVISAFQAKRRTSDLENVTYLYSLYNTADKTLLWQAEGNRLAGFLGGMPKPEETIAVLKKHLKEAKIIE